MTTAVVNKRYSTLLLTVRDSLGPDVTDMATIARAIRRETRRMVNDMTHWVYKAEVRLPDDWPRPRECPAAEWRECQATGGWAWDTRECPQPGSTQLPPDMAAMYEGANACDAVALLLNMYQARFGVRYTLASKSLGACRVLALRRTSGRYVARHPVKNPLLMGRRWHTLLEHGAPHASGDGRRTYRHVWLTLDVETAAGARVEVGFDATGHQYGWDNTGHRDIVAWHVALPELGKPYVAEKTAPMPSYDECMRWLCLLLAHDSGQDHHHHRHRQ